MLMLDEKVVSIVEIRTKSKDELLKLINDCRQTGTQRHLIICSVSFIESLIEELDAFRNTAY